MSEKMIFCLGEGKYKTTGIGYQKNHHIFNKSVTEEEYNKVKSALDIKNFKLPIAKWVETNDMTEAEKKNWSSHKQTGGFLKTLSYQDAWKEMWATLSQEDKHFFEGITGFDSDIFEGITGIKIETTPISEIIELNGKKYKLVD